MKRNAESRVPILGRMTTDGVDTGNGKLAGRCAVVTGSSRGFGAEIARTLAREGHGS